MNLLKFELKKLSKTNYLIASFLIMLLIPLITLLWMSLNPRGFILGDFNQMNLTFLGLIGCRTIFPMTGMLMMKVEYDNNGWISAFVTPLERRKLLFLKLIISIIWSALIIVFSILVVIVTEVILFNDLSIAGLIAEHISSYVYLMIYLVPFIIIGMFLSFLFSHTIIPIICLSLTIFIGYMTQLFNKNLYLPSAIPEFILSPYTDYKIGIAYMILYVLSFAVILLMERVIYLKDY